MNDENDSFKFFKSVLISMGNIMQEFFYGQYYNTTNRLNTSCTKEMQCENTAMFCNLTTLLCQCAVFHLWNDAVGICEFKHEYLTEWIANNRTDDIIYVTKIVPEQSLSRYAIPWPIIIVMIIGGLCFLFCTVYICYGQEEVDEDKTVSAALFKQYEQTSRLQTSIVEKL